MTTEHLKVVIEHFDAIASKYASGQARRLDVSRLLALANLSRDDYVLDVATGTGAFARAAAQRARVVVGVDVSARMLTEAASGDCEPRPVFVRAPAQRLPFGAASFDVAVCCRALHHMADPERTVAEIARVLRSGGRFVVVDNATSGDPSFAHEHNHLERLRDPSHARTLSTAELRGLMNSAGLRLTLFDIGESLRSVDEWLEDAGADSATREKVFTELAGRQERDDSFYVEHIVDTPAAGMVFRYRLAWAVATKVE